MSRYQCRRAGCGRGPATGDALHRTSPKGELFEGECTEHFAEHGTPEPIAVMIEKNNRRGRDES